MLLTGTIVTVAKVAALAGCGYGIWNVSQSFPVPAARSRLMRCFKLGELCIRKKGAKGKEQRIYPSIERVDIEPDRLKLHFTLPLGLDPKEITEHTWLFQQQFGKHIIIEGEQRAFMLTVYRNQIKSFKYDYSEFETEMNEMTLPIICGRSREGVKVYDMIENPHLLIAGETGCGKSTQLRAILSSLITHFSSDEMRLYLGDLKRSEFHIFKDVAHVEKNVIDEDELLSMLLDIDREMKKRGDLLNKHGEAHISDLPASIRPPWFIVCIDEVALVKGNGDIMELIEKIAQIGRALGVFLILSMQRPDAKVLDGKIKQCLTVRMAFRQADAINSGIVIGQKGAEDITQKGMMLLKHERIERVQGPFLELKKAKELLAPYKIEKPTEPDPEPSDDDPIGGLDDD